MERRTAGVMLLGIAALLYGIRYLCAAIRLSGIPDTNPELFRIALRTIGRAPLVLSVIALIAGLIYLFAAEFGNPFRGSLEQIRKNWNEFQTEGQAANEPKDENASR